MNNEDIIRMAKEAFVNNPDRFVEGWTIMHHKELARFAALVAAAEREACAQILDRNVAVCGNNTPMRDVLSGNAMAIRARGQA
jgi:hypothetical protein